MSTKMWYHEDAYLREHQSKVRRVDGNRVLLHETIFFPETATEPGDTGTMDNHKVVKVERDREKDEVWHILGKAPDLNPGDAVDLSIDWDERYKMMRLHSALHLLAGCFGLLFRQRAVAGTVESDSAYLVFKQSVDEYVKDSIDQANDDIADGLTIKTYEDKERKGFRWCKVGDYSPIPCGGIHVKNTEEIGKIFLKEKKADGQGQRIVIGVE